jgi:hypothetical protein
MSAKQSIAKACKQTSLRVETPDEPPEVTMGKLAAQPFITSALVSAAFSRYVGEVDATVLHNTMKGRAKQVCEGDMRGVEETLLAQAAALNSIFSDLAQRSAQNVGQYMNAMETYMRLALRAQNQCRMTLETLAAIKNPPVVFAKQANIAHGHQQVNNGDAVPVARAGEISNRPTELLEAPDAKPEWMDARAVRAATPSHSAVATVEAVKRPQNTRR